MKDHNKVIIFDFWQTLADSTIKPSGLINYMKLKNVSVQKLINNLFQSEMFLQNIPLNISMGKLMLSLNIYKKKQIESAINLWKEMAYQAFLYDGAEELLLYFKNRKYKLCLMTNIDRFGYENFPKKEIFEYFDYKFLSYIEGIVKPNIKCWLMIKEKLNTEFNNMIMIGDSYEYDILPAEELGISTIMVNSNTNLLYLLKQFKSKAISI